MLASGRVYARAARAAHDALQSLYQFKRTELGAALGYDDFYPVDLDSLVRLLGWTVTSVALIGVTTTGEHVEGDVDFSTRTITLPIDDQPNKLRFSLAHEIGHISLHGEKGFEKLRRIRAARPVRSSRPRYSDSYEVEANRFATELLMPAKAVQWQFNRLFRCSEVFTRSARTSKLVAEYGAARRLSYPLDERSLANFLGTTAPDSSSRSLADFFGVTQTAIGLRLLEVGIVLE